MSIQIGANPQHLDYFVLPQDGVRVGLMTDGAEGMFSCGFRTVFKTLMQYIKPLYYTGGSCEKLRGKHHP